MRTAISEMKKEESVSVPVFVREYAVPEMLIKLRQGCGRLVRSETDTGLISILDSRCNGTGYSASIDHALKKYPRVNSIQEAQEFMRSIKDEAYFGWEQAKNEGISVEYEPIKKLKKFAFWLDL